MCTTASRGTDMARADGLLSVIVPVYNVEPYLEDCVRSILSQTYAPLEALLIDDGSTDGSGAMCDALAKEDARVRVFHKENGGQAAAKNLGIANARGAYLGFVDGDDHVAAEMYASLIAAMEANGANIAECAFNYVFPDRAEHSGNDTGAVKVYARDKAIRRMALGQELMIESARKVYRKDALGNARFPEGTLFEEVGFLRRMYPTMGAVAYVDRPYYQYRQQRAGSTNASFPPQKLAVIGECDAFVSELRQAGQREAADAVAAFTLDHIMRMFRNARACRADAAILKTLRRAYRTRYQQEKGNPDVRKLRGLLFALSPDAYDRLSRCLHSR